MKLKSLRSVDLKESNRLNILKLLLKSNYSRVEIANKLEMSRPAVSAIIEELIAEGLVKEMGQGNSTPIGGKRPILLKLNSRAGLIAAVHFSDSMIMVAITDLKGNIIAYKERESIIRDNFQESFDIVVQEIKFLLEDKDVKEMQSRCICCSISFKGLVNTDLGSLEYSASIPQWRRVPIREYMSEQLRIPVFIENHARALTIAEMQIDNGINGKNFVCVHMAKTGIGTGVVVDYEILRGTFYGAVTFAHTTILDQGPRCLCGNNGCWEALASVSALSEELAMRDNRYKGLSITDIHRLFTEDDPVVTDVVLNHTGYWIGVGIANILNVFNPEMVIIQGLLNIFGEKLLNKINEVAKSRALPISGNIQIIYSKITDRVDAKAAAAIAINHFFSIDYHYKIWRGNIAV